MNKLTNNQKFILAAMIFNAFEADVQTFAPAFNKTLKSLVKRGLVEMLGNGYALTHDGYFLGKNFLPANDNVGNLWITNFLAQDGKWASTVYDASCGAYVASFFGLKSRDAAIATGLAYTSHV